MKKDKDALTFEDLQKAYDDLLDRTWYPSPQIEYISYSEYLKRIREERGDGDSHE